MTTLFTRTLRATLALSLAGLLVAVGLVGFSAAFVSDQEQSSANSVSAGDLELASPADGTTLFPGADLRPNETRSKAITVTNDGSLPARVFLSLAPPSNAVDLLDVLDVTIVECTAAQAPCSPGNVVGTVAATAPLSSRLGTNLDLGTIAANGATRHFVVSVAWPLADDDPDLYGQSATFGVTWSLRNLDASAVSLP